MPQEKSLTTDGVVRILAERDPDSHPVATSSYVAEEAGVSRPTALTRLKEARDEGRVRSAEVGQASVWWSADDPITAKRTRQTLSGDGDEARSAIGGDSDHTGESEEAPVVSDGGVSPGAQILLELLPLAPVTEQGREAVGRSASEIGMGLVGAAIVLFGGIFHAAVGLPGILQTIFGIAGIAAVWLLLGGSIRLGAVAIGWYERSDSTQATSQ